MFGRFRVCGRGSRCIECIVRSWEQKVECEQESRSYYRRSFEGQHCVFFVSSAVLLEGIVREKKFSPPTPKLPNLPQKSLNEGIEM